MNAKKIRKYNDYAIRILVDENPKRPSSKAFKKFAVLMKHDGETIQELKKEYGKHPTLDNNVHWITTELRWAINQGFVKIVKAIRGHSVERERNVA